MSQFSSEGFDLDAASNTNGEDVVLELGGGATVLPKQSPEKPKQPAQQDPEIEKSQQCKAEGNRWFQAGNYLQAYDCYTDAMEACPGTSGKELLSLKNEYDEEQRVKANEEFRQRDLERRKEMHDRAKQTQDKAKAGVGVHDNNTSTASSSSPPTKDKDNANPQPPRPFQAPPHKYAKELSVYHCNRAACCMHLDRIEDAINDCHVALLLQPAYIKALTRRCLAFEKLEKYEEALEDATVILKLQPNNNQMRQKIPMLEQKRQAQMEKLKKETMGQLKELGNSLLGNFGLSLDNFKAVQDPNTGSYSVSFDQNA